MNARLTLLAAGFLLVLLLLPRPPGAVPRDTPGDPDRLESGSEGSSDITSHRFRRSAHATSGSGSLRASEDPVPNPASPATNSLSRFLGEGAEMPEVPLETIQAWIARGNTNVEDLLAARQAGGGTNFLHLALARFPSDPRVLFAAMALDDGPEAHRDRLDRLKAAAPDNALVTYLSALEHLKAGHKAEALAELALAPTQKTFEDYSFASAPKATELYLEAGHSPAEAAALGMSTALMPHLPQLKNLAVELAALGREAVGAGDAAAAQALAQSCLELAGQLTSGGGSHTLIGQLVGAAVAKIALRPLPPDATPEYLGGATVGDYVAQVDAWRRGQRENAEFVEGWLRTASDADLLAYFERLKTQKESEVAEWVRSQAKSGP